MPKVSFAEAEAQDALGATPKETSEAPAPTGSEVALRDDKAVSAAAAYAPPAAYTSDEDADGEFTQRDMKYPRFSVVQKSGELSDEFTPGEFVISKEFVFGAHDKPVNLIALQIQKRYQEFLPYGSQQIPRLFSTAAEVAAAGLSLEWGAKNRASEILNILFWIPQPVEGEGDHVFLIEGPKGRGVVAGYTAARTAYGTVGKTLIQAKRTFCAPEKGGMVAMEWQLSATLEKKDMNSWYLPRLKPVGPTDPELASFLRNLKSNG